MSIQAVEFGTAWEGRVESTYDGIPILVIGRRELIATKRAVGRPQDLIDVDNLLSPDGEPREAE